MRTVADLCDRILNPVYERFGHLAALFLLAIAVLVLTSIVSRAFNIYIPSLNVYAGFAMAASMFFAMASTFANGKHVRVSLFLHYFDHVGRWRMEIISSVVAVLITSFISYYLIKMTHVSWQFDEKSEGIDATPLWIPQLSLALGFSLLTVICLHHLVRMLADQEDGSIDTSASDGGY